MKRKFTITEPSGNTVELAVVFPSVEQKANADIHKSVMFGKYAKSGVLFKDVILKLMRDQGMWDDERESQREELLTIISQGTEKLLAVGIMKSEAKEIALKVRSARVILTSLMSEYNNLEQNSVEGKAEQAKFEWLISQCTLYNEDGKKYFASLTDYKNKEDEPHVQKIANEFQTLYYDIDSVLRELPENKFLIEHGFMNEDFTLKDSETESVEEPAEPKPFIDD